MLVAEYGFAQFGISLAYFLLECRVADQSFPEDRCRVGAASVVCPCLNVVGSAEVAVAVCQILL